MLLLLLLLLLQLAGTRRRRLLGMLMVVSSAGTVVHDLKFSKPRSGFVQIGKGPSRIFVVEIVGGGLLACCRFDLGPFAPLVEARHAHGIRAGREGSAPHVVVVTPPSAAAGVVGVPRADARVHVPGPHAEHGREATEPPAGVLDHARPVPRRGPVDEVRRREVGVEALEAAAREVVAVVRL